MDISAFLGGESFLKAIATCHAKFTLNFFSNLHILIYKYTFQQVKILVKIKKQNPMKILIIWTSSLSITVYKTYKFIYQLRFFQGVVFLCQLFRCVFGWFLKRSSIGSLRISAGVSFQDLRAAQWKSFVQIQSCIIK